MGTLPLLADGLVELGRLADHHPRPGAREHQLSPLSYRDCLPGLDAVHQRLVWLDPEFHRHLHRYRAEHCEPDDCAVHAARNCVLGGLAHGLLLALVPYLGFSQEWLSRRFCHDNFLQWYQRRCRCRGQYYRTGREFVLLDHWHPFWSLGGTFTTTCSCGFFPC